MSTDQAVDDLLRVLTTKDSKGEDDEGELFDLDEEGIFGILVFWYFWLLVPIMLFHPY